MTLLVYSEKINNSGNRAERNCLTKLHPPLHPQVAAQGWACDEAFAAKEDLNTLAARAQLASVVVVVLAPSLRHGGEGGGSHTHLEKLLWYLLGQKKVRVVGG